MGLVDFRRGRTLDADPQGERRNGNNLIAHEANPALIGQALLDLCALVVAELQRRDEEAREDSKTNDKKGGES